MECDELRDRFAPARAPRGRIVEARTKNGPYVDCSREPEAEAWVLDSPIGRELLGLSGEKVCDGAVWTRGDVVFVELKTGSFENADEQLASAIRAFRALGPRCPIRAVVVMSGSAPRSEPDLRRRFRNAVKAPLRVVHSRKGRVDRKKPVPNSREVLPHEL